MQPTLDSLEKKGLIQYLTPPGRGCVVTHALYLERELDKVRREAGALQHAGNAPESASSHESQPAAAVNGSDDALNDQVRALRDEVNALKREIASARADFESVAEQLRHDLTALNHQLGN